jgi:hypothetical protein
LTARRLLLTTFDQRLLALALRGSGSCVSGHAEAPAYTIAGAMPKAQCPMLDALSIAPTTG